MKKSTLLLAMSLMLGCAANKMAANNMDYLLETQIEKRLPLYAGQKERLSEDVDLFLNQQKDFAKQVLPLVMDVELDVKKVDQQYGHLKEIYRRLSQSFSRLISHHMAELDEKQQKDFARVLQEENHQMRRLKSNQQMEKLFDRLELLFGSITERQKKLLREYKGYLYQRHLLRVERREKLHERFKEIYQMDLSREELANRHYEAFIDFQKNYPDDPKNLKLIKDFIPTLTTAQKETFERRMKNLRELLGYFLEASY